MRGLSVTCQMAVLLGNSPKSYLLLPAGINREPAAFTYFALLSHGKAVMDITTVVIWAIALLCIAVYWIAASRDKRPPQAADIAPRDSAAIALRDSAAIALSNYWSHYYEGWSLVLLRDLSGTIRHVTCGLPDGTFFYAGDYCNETQIAQRLGVRVTAENCDEAEVQSLLGTNNAVLEAAEELRHCVELEARKT